VGSKEPKHAVVVAEGDGSLLIGEIRLLGRARRRNPAAGLGIPERPTRRDNLAGSFPFLPNPTTPTIVQTGNAIASGLHWLGVADSGRSASLGPLAI